MPPSLRVGLITCLLAGLSVALPNRAFSAEIDPNVSVLLESHCGGANNASQCRPCDTDEQRRRSPRLVLRTTSVIPGDQTATGRPISVIEGTFRKADTWIDAGKKDEFGFCDRVVNPIERWGAITYDVTGTVDWNANGTGKIRFDGVFSDGPMQPRIECTEFSSEGSLRPVGVLSIEDLTGEFILIPPETRIQDLINPRCEGVVQEAQECQSRTFRPGMWKCSANLGGGELTGATETLTGKLESSLPTITDPELPDRQVHRANIAVYEQQLGAVRFPMPSETAAEYRDYLRTQARALVASVTINRDGGGQSTPDNPGVFEIKNLPIARISRDTPTKILYTIEVTDAETDEIELDSGGQPDPNTRMLLPFRDAAVPNVDLVGLPPNFKIFLDPFTAVGAKRVLAERIAGVCPINYAPIEEAVVDFLDDIEDGTIPLDEVVEEALERGLWAERAVLYGALLSEELIEESISALGVLLANIYDDATDFTRTDIVKTRKVFNRIKAAEAKNGFGFTEQTKEALGALTSTEIDLLIFSMVGKILKAVFKVMAPYMESALVAAGVERGSAETLSKGITLAVMSVLSAVETGTKEGALTPVVKLIIEQSTQALAPGFLDAPDPLTAPNPSYCGRTDDFLQSAASQMIAWNSFDPGWEATDRGRVVETITALNDDATFALATARFQAEITAGLDNNETLLGFLELLPGAGQATAQAVSAAKYLTNFASIVAPMVTVYAVVPDAVESAVSEAFGGPSTSIVAGGVVNELFAAPPVSGFVSAGDAVTSALGQVDDSQALFDALDTIEAEILSNEIGNAVEATFGTDAGSYLNLIQDWHRSVELWFAEIFAIDGGTGFLLPSSFGGQFYALRQWAQLRAAEVDLLEIARDFYGAVLSAEYDHPADPDYLGDRLKLIAAIATVRGQLDHVDGLVGGNTHPFGSVTTRPVIALEFLDVVSDSTGDRFISQTPESFTLRALVRNLGDTEVSGLSLRLNITSPKDSLMAAGATELPVGTGTLMPDDDVDGSGDDEAMVMWQLDYTGDLSWETIGLVLDLRENGEDPSTFLNDPEIGLLSVDPELGDTDLDGIPDDLEDEVGLTVGVDDSESDLDGDGLDNLVELLQGTDPDAMSSDADSLSDLEELTRGADGFVTNPLDEDTDADGTPDDMDGAPTDQTSTDEPIGGSEGEPEVAVDMTVVDLADGVESAAIEVTNSGTGELTWVASATNPSLVDVAPGPGTISPEGTVLTIGAPDSFDFNAVGLISTTVIVTDVAGADNDSQVITVRMGNQADVDFCGHATDATLGGPVTANDALETLLAGVGARVCQLCRCDVNKSGDNNASDALEILKKAVGQNVTLDCIPCL